MSATSPGGRTEGEGRERESGKRVCFAVVFAQEYLVVCVQICMIAYCMDIRVDTLHLEIQSECTFQSRTRFEPDQSSIRFNTEIPALLCVSERHVMIPQLLTLISFDKNTAKSYERLSIATIFCTRDISF